MYVFTGEGKGKTSAAIGTAVRAVGAGMRVAWVGFYKQASWKLAEVEPLIKLGVRVELMGKGFYLGEQVTSNKKQVKIVKIKNGQVVVDGVGEAEHKLAARAAVLRARGLVGKVDMLVLDEVNNALADGLIDLDDLIDLISDRKQTHLIMTGRRAVAELVEKADLVTEMKKIKHPYDEGQIALRGLDF